MTRGSTLELGLELLQSAAGCIKLTQDTVIIPTKYNSYNKLVWWCINKIIFRHGGLYFLSPILTTFESKYIYLSIFEKQNHPLNTLTPASAAVIFGTIFL